MTAIDGADRSARYEDVCEDPGRELAGLFRRWGEDERIATGQGLGSQAERPSGTAVRRSAIVSGGDRIRRWQEALSPSQIGRILDVVAAFGLGHLYGRGAMPRVRTPV